MEVIAQSFIIEVRVAEFRNDISIKVALSFLALYLIVNISSEHGVMITKMNFDTVGLQKIFHFVGPQCLSKYFLQVMRFQVAKSDPHFLIISDFFNDLSSSTSLFL